jgi:hypothetical protein
MLTVVNKSIVPLKERGHGTVNQTWLASHINNGFYSHFIMITGQKYRAVNIFVTFPIAGS